MNQPQALLASVIVTDVDLTKPHGESEAKTHLINRLALILAEKIVDNQDWMNTNYLQYGREYSVNLVIATPEQYLERLNKEATRLSYIMRDNRMMKLSDLQGQ